MTFYKPNIQEIGELASFLSKLNNQKQSHIGFCGGMADEIERTLQEDFLEENGKLSFMAAKSEKDELIAAVGLDMEDDTAEVWGPFQASNDTNMVMKLWEQLRSKYPLIHTFLFFIDEENTQQTTFTKRISAKHTGRHSILELKKEYVKSVDNKKSVPFANEDFPAFQKLHDETFPGTYYDAATIFERLKDGHKLNVLKTPEGLLEGYAYYEVDKQFQGASIEYIAINPLSRGKGLGALLLSETVEEMFTSFGIPEIRLVVSHEDRAARHLYLKTGFTEVNVLNSYTYTSS